MNKFIKTLLFFYSATLLAACSSTQKITVRGIPDTKICNSKYEHLGTIQGDGKAQIKITTKEYTPFLLANANGSDEYIPFAIDYKYKNYNTPARVLSIFLFTIYGSFPFWIYIANNPDQKCNLYRYLPYQQTNQDLIFSNYTNNGAKRSIDNDKAKHSEEQRPVTASKGTSSTARSIASKSTKTFKDLGKLVAGTYVGTGKLTLKGKMIEEYKNIQIVFTKIDKTDVNAEIIESNGESFFSSDNRYSISKNGNDFSLVLQGIPSAVVTIKENGHLSYYHPKVNIDGDIYTLEISATKK